MHAPVPCPNDLIPEPDSDDSRHTRPRPSDSDHKYIADRIKAIDESVAYFGAGEDKKFEREKWVAMHFADDIGAPALTEPLQPPSDATVDVFYGDARFQIKEPWEKGRRRHHEFKEAAKEYRLATYAADTLSMGPLEDLSVNDIVGKVLDVLPNLRDGYQASVRNTLDLLLCANFWCTTEGQAIPDCPTISAEGWRSVSVLTNDGSFVLFAQSTAPEWIRDRVGAKCKRMPGNTHIRVRLGRNQGSDDYLGVRSVSPRAGALVATTIAELNLLGHAISVQSTTMQTKLKSLCWGIDTSGYQESRVPDFEAALNRLIGDTGLQVVSRSVTP